jgi:very-short-patch-repair endonuclease
VWVTVAQSLAGTLWAYLRGNKLNGVNFRRQHAIGDFIVDFVSVKKELMIEPDDTPFGRNAWSRKNMMLSGPAIWNHLRNIGSSTIVVL